MYLKLHSFNIQGEERESRYGKKGGIGGNT